MDAVDQLRGQLPEVARDVSLNLQSTLGPSSLTDAQRLGVALACAWATGNRALVDALLVSSPAPGVVEDARAAAVLMAMNNVYYRFRHQVGKDVYSQKPARLRMQRIAKPATSKADFELMCLAVSAIAGCEACVRSHEMVVIQAGLTDEQVHDAVRLAATVRAVGVAMTV